MIDKIELISLKGVALKDHEYRYRKVCRYYSKHFNTPLDQVYKLPWHYVLQNYLEDVIDQNNGQDDIYQLCLEIVYPEKLKQEEEAEEKSIQEYIKQIEREEEEKRRKKKEQEQSKIEMDQSQFDHLEKEMSEEESD